MKNFKKVQSQISYSFLFSITLHICLGFFVFKNSNSSFVASADKASNLVAKPTSIKLDSIKFISPKQLKAIKDSQSKQIVATETNGRNEKPVNSRFAGEKDQTFDRQTIASSNGSFKEAGKGFKAGSAHSLAQIPAPKTSVRVKASSGFKKPLSLSDLGGFKMADIEKHQAEAHAAIEEMSKEMEAKSSQAEALGVEKGKSGINGLAQNNDFVEDVPLGDMTNLNTTEFKYYGFYHRIRQKLEQHWGSSIKDKAKNLYRSGRRMPASENLITAVTVVLNDKGNIIDIKIEGTSGIRELDQAAIESFNKAGPFPNPPKGLLVGGRATIQWGFVVKS